jgi:hypothetical protein
MQVAMTKEDIEQIISRIKFQDREFRILEKGDGFLLQMRYMEPDVNQPNSLPVLQSTRKYYLSPFMTVSEIVETAWLMVQRSQLHIASEHFTYFSHRVYSQHFDVDARMGMCIRKLFDHRDEG